MAKISIFGLGYVGAVSIAALADNDNEIIGVDVNTTKVEMINAGQSPIIEADLPELMKKGWMVAVFEQRLMPWRQCITAIFPSFV